jgi:hypothetical protein
MLKVITLNGNLIIKRIDLHNHVMVMDTDNDVPIFLNLGTRMPSSDQSSNVDLKSLSDLAQVVVLEELGLM